MWLGNPERRLGHGDDRTTASRAPCRWGACGAIHPLGNFGSSGQPRGFDVFAPASPVFADTFFLIGAASALFAFASPFFATGFPLLGGGIPG